MQKGYLSDIPGLNYYFIKRKSWTGFIYHRNIRSSSALEAYHLHLRAAQHPCAKGSGSRPEMARTLLFDFAWNVKAAVNANHQPDAGHYNLWLVGALVDLLDGWLDLSRLNLRAQQARPASESQPAKVEWRAQRVMPNGWLVPIPVGYGALGPMQAAGSVANARDGQTPLRFVESLYSIGQWLSPHRLRDVDDLLWYASADPQAGLYRCHNLYSQTLCTDDME